MGCHSRASIHLRRRGKFLDASSSFSPAVTYQQLENETKSRNQTGRTLDLEDSFSLAAEEGRGGARVDVEEGMSVEDDVGVDESTGAEEGIGAEDGSEARRDSVDWH